MGRSVTQHALLLLQCMLVLPPWGVASRRGPVLLPESPCHKTEHPLIPHSGRVPSTHTNNLPSTGAPPCRTPHDAIWDSQAMPTPPVPTKPAQASGLEQKRTMRCPPSPALPPHIVCVCGCGNVICLVNADVYL
ncbi:hypothetical protein AMECASPLE_009711 [Ameca splendens]|uniref:Uncharacterized protein n=1 Tax=Ameca splendens TaxID=208324 RepID=A0ABV0Z937_9TELE